MSDDDNEASHSDSSEDATSSATVDSPTVDTQQQQNTAGGRLDVDHMYSDQSQDEQPRSRNTVIRDIVKVITSLHCSLYLNCKSDA